MQKLKIFIGIVFLAIVFFTACEPKEPKGSGNTTDTGVVINGVKWATRNVDAFGTFAVAPESSGMFYQWNRPIAWNSVDEYVTGWDNTPAAGTTWEPQNDPCPPGWRVPTRTELESLLYNDRVTSVWTTEKGINGRRFTEKNTNKTIFLPASGIRSFNDGGALGGVGSNGLYWSSMESDSHYAYLLHFYSDSAYLGGASKVYGRSVRCVAE